MILFLRHSSILILEKYLLFNAFMKSKNYILWYLILQKKLRHQRQKLIIYVRNMSSYKNSYNQVLNLSHNAV